MQRHPDDISLSHFAKLAKMFPKRHSWNELHHNDTQLWVGMSEDEIVEHLADTIVSTAFH